jgi:hypothetical protein
MIPIFSQPAFVSGHCGPESLCQGCREEKETKRPDETIDDEMVNVMYFIGLVLWMSTLCPRKVGTLSLAEFAKAALGGLFGAVNAVFAEHYGRGDYGWGIAGRLRGRDGIRRTTWKKKKKKKKQTASP